MKQTFKYMAISKRTSNRFGLYSYILNLTDDGKLIKGDCLQYGYLSNQIKIGGRKGWFIKPISMYKYEIENHYKFLNGTVTVTISS
jgi:hypothetical protein